MFADDADHGMAITNIVGEPAKQCRVVGSLPEIALHMHRVTLRAQIAGNGVARLAEFAGDGGDEDLQADTDDGF
jgi:hypothetical protein